jgi:hypothetical protein
VNALASEVVRVMCAVPSIERISPYTIHAELDVGPTDLEKSETNNDAKEAELPARKEDESDGTRKTRSGRTTKPAPRLTLKVETTAKPHHW